MRIAALAPAVFDEMMQRIDSGAGDVGILPEVEGGIEQAALRQAPRQAFPLDGRQLPPAPRKKRQTGQRADKPDRITAHWPGPITGVLIAMLVPVG